MSGLLPESPFMLAVSPIGSIERHAKKAKLSVEELKLPPITAMASELCKEGEWDNALTCHANSPVARSWNVQNRVIGKHKLAHSSLPRGSAATVCLTILFESFMTCLVLQDQFVLHAQCIEEMYSACCCMKKITPTY